MNGRTLLLLIPCLASCGGSGTNEGDASVADALQETPDLPAPSVMEVWEPTPDAVVPDTSDAQDGPQGGMDAKDWDGYPGSGCKFKDSSGWAVVTKVVYSSDPGHECQAVVTFEFMAGLALDAGSAGMAVDGGSPGGTSMDGGVRPAGGRMMIHPLETPPCSYLESNGVVVGGTLPAIRQDAFAGACPTPVYVFPTILNAQYMGP